MNYEWEKGEWGKGKKQEARLETKEKIQITFFHIPWKRRG